MIRVRVLGEVDLQIGHRRVGMNTETLFALAFFLVMRAGEPIPRDELLTTLWDQGEDEQRRHALRQLLYRLRQKGLDLAEDGERVLLSSERVDCDFLSALDPKWPDQATAAEIDAAAAFGPSFSKRMASGYLQWLDGRLNALAEQHRKASLGQIALARREGRWADLERWAQSVLRTDPLNEEATLARAESAAMGGSKVMAMEILDNYLAEVWEISPELGKPAQALRKRLAERRPDWSYRGPREVPLVGRTELMSRLTTLVDAAWKGDGGAVVLVGAPGIGKTRLAMETRAYAELKGMRTVVVRAEAGMVERPLSIVIELATALLKLDGSIGCNPESLSLLRRITSLQLRADVDGASRPISSHVANALADLAQAVQAEKRLLVVLDDLQSSDAESLDVLATVFRSSSRSRIAWVCTSRTKRLKWTPNSDLPLPILIVRVEPLSAAASQQLSRRTSEAHHLGVDEIAERSVAHASGGNPLFVRELVMATARSANQPNLPVTLQDLIAERMGRLTASQLRIVRVVALLGAEATPARLARFIADDGVSLADEVERLEDDGLIAIGENRAIVLHECWQQGVIESMAPATTAVIAHECSRVLLEELNDSSPPRMVWRTAEVLRLSGERELSLKLLMRAADRMFSDGLVAESARVLKSALALTAEGYLQQELLVRLSRSQLLSGRPEECLQSCDEYLASTRFRSDPDLAQSFSLRVTRSEALAKLCLPHSADLLALVQQLEDECIDPTLRLRGALTVSRLSANGTHLDIEDQLYVACQRLQARFPESVHLLLALMIYQTERGPEADLAETHCRLQKLIETVADYADQCMALRLLAHSKRIAGDIPGAVEAGTRAFHVARTRTLPDDAAISAELLTFIALDQCDVPEAERWRDIAASIRERPGYVQRSIALRHATERIFLQLGEHDAVVAHLQPRLVEIRADRTDLSRSTELATLAVALAHEGARKLSRELAGEALEGGRVLRGFAAGDFIHETSCQALSLLGLNAESTAVAREHMLARSRFPRPLAPYFRLLAAAAG